ncbi:efflux transporter outer membrane subunit [Pedosphaera parvula]|uniref:RND efflux system, outer membrane lipoprotein, NodT family n=1 Tax=Pedosphaera parvula (strain Ellin514) TaxID=320771 RepID=B9XBM4_PEDPL|nr:efflux transporter outer membrane subunit [Pedosphaera parvula]EEF62909.1 RND efflux system, outer membrane lipoprotein, NodT family [Pedosphaera parvula Ellin514]
MNNQAQKPNDRLAPSKTRSGIRVISCFLLVGILASTVILVGCAVGPNYKRPTVNSPNNFRSATGPPTTNSFGDLPWWEIFQDDTLQNLIKIALTNNYDIRVAATRVEQARAIYAENRAAFFPQLGYQVGASRGKNALFTTPFFNNGRVTSDYIGAGNVSWEIDLWGRIRRLNEAAQAQYFASQEARRNVMITLIADLAQSYLQLLALDRELEITRQNTASFSDSLKIFNQRLEQGVASKLETSRAAAALASTAASIPDLERQIVIQENQISVLLGQNPGPVFRNKNLLQLTLPPDVPAGLPSSLLQRRPDIREADQLFRSANAQIGVAVADFLPVLDLTALLGAVSPELSAITSGKSGLWSVAGSLTGPIFQGGRLVGQYHAAQAVREQARLSYQQTALIAFQEVSNALIARQKFQEIRVQQTLSVSAYEEAVRVSTQRYLVGQASYYELLEAQQQLFPAQISLVQTQLNQFLAVVQLYRALGGGWQPEVEAKKP